MIADANAVLALIVDDRPEQTAVVLEAIASAVATGGWLDVPQVVVAEVAFVLERGYHYHRRAAATTLLELFGAPGLRAAAPARLDHALRLVLARPALSVVDALVLEEAVDSGDDVLTFDRLMQRTALEYVEIPG